MLALGVPDYGTFIPELALGVPDYGTVIPELAMGVPDYGTVIPELALGVPDYGYSRVGVGRTWLRLFQSWRWAYLITVIPETRRAH